MKVVSEFWKVYNFIIWRNLFEKVINKDLKEVNLKEVNKQCG